MKGRTAQSSAMKSVLDVLPGLYRSPAAAATAAVAAQRSSRCFSDKGRVLSEEEKAAETIYIQKMERERLEKLRRKAEKEKAEAEKKKAEAEKK